MEKIPLTFYTGGFWEKCDNGSEEYRGGHIFLELIDAGTSFEQLVETLYNRLQRSQMEYKVCLKSCISSYSRGRIVIDIGCQNEWEWFLNFHSNAVRQGSVVELYLTWDRRSGSDDQQSGGPSSSSFNMVSQSIPIYASDEAHWDNYTMGMDDGNVQGVWLGEGSWSSGGFSTNDMTGPSIAPTNIRPDASRCLPPIVSSTDMPSDNNISASGGGTLSVGKCYSSKIELRRDLALIALRGHFNTTVSRSTSTRFEARCSAESCDWKVRARSVPGVEISNWLVTEFVKMHTCTSDDVDAGCSSLGNRVVGDIIKGKFLDANRIVKPKDIVTDMQAEYGVQLSYNQAWRSREFAMEAVRGSAEEAYTLLPLYSHVLQSKNPGTFTHFHCNDEGQFLYYFVAMGQSLRGFLASIRPVIAVDGTFLKGKYRGSLFVAAAKDGNNQIYPLAFGIMDSENDQSWSWFMSKLRCCIGDVPEIVFISDRHGSIEKAIIEVFPEASHGVCIHHVSVNLKARFRMRPKDMDNFLATYFAAAKAYRRQDFEEQLQKLWQINPDAARYLEENVQCNRWARAEFSSRRYNMMTTNIAESLNALLREARALPVLSLLTYIRMTLQRWFFERRESAEKIITPLTPWAQEKVDKRRVKAQRMSVAPADRYEFEVRGGDRIEIVNIKEKTCSCRKFDLEQLPCSHALAVCAAARIKRSSLWSKMYTADALRSAYAETIHPVGDQSDWVVPEELSGFTILPPNQRISAGRPKTTRRPSQGEEPVHVICGRCGERGHNRRSCMTPLSQNR